MTRDTIPPEVRRMKTSDLIAAVAASKAAEAASLATWHTTSIGGYVSPQEREDRQRRAADAAARYALYCAELDARIPPREVPHG